MTIFTLINTVQDRGIQLWQEKGQLKLKAPKGALTDDIREQLIANKDAIIAFLHQVSATSSIPAILPINRAELDELPLSFAQERLWFIDQLEAGSASYNVPGAVTISGELDINQVEYAINLIIARHENLRTIFPSQDGQAQQVILDHLEFSLERIDLRDDETEIRQSKAQQLCEIEAATPFDLATGPLIRGKVITLAPQQHILMLNLHHIVSDGWSIAVLMKEFGAIMDALQQGTAVDLPRLPIQYVDYSVWQRKWLEEGGVLKQQLAYWKEKLAGVPESVNLATDYPRPLLQSYAGASHPFTLGKQLTAHLKNLAEQQSCTLYMTLLAAVKVLLYRYSGQEDICVGGPIANRQYGETEGLIGMFVNTLALRSLLKSEDTFTAVLGKVKTTCLEAYEHQDTPFEKIVELVQVQRNMAMSPLFQIMVSLQNTPIEKFEQHIRAYPLNNGISKFDLTVEFTESSEGLDGIIEYSTALYKPQTIERMVTNFISLCEAIVAESGAKIRDLDYLDPVEKHRLLTDFNNTQADYPQDKCLHQLFAEQVKRTPEKIAVVYENESLSYQQLYDKSYALAVYLQSLGVKPDSLVGLCVERSLDMVVGMLGILQAGGAYVPLDPDYPDDRLAYMLQDSQAAIVLTQEKLKTKLAVFVTGDTQLVALDQLLPDHEMGVTLQEEVTPEHLAYVIYTSGSTGQPKGVMVEHKSVQSLCAWHQREFNVDGTTVATQTANIAFDAAVWEIWPYLLASACLVLVRTELSLEVTELHHFIVDHQITHCFLVTPLAQQLLQLNHLTSSPLQYLLTGGDKLATYENKHYPFRVVNNYGPTEATVVATSFRIEESFTAQNIGHPIDNTQIYILDSRNNLQPIGVPGELHIAGDGLARGYLNRPDLTDEKFIPNPFHPGTRLYKTGDLARWLPDGTLEYLGRIDTQIKIRGFRIETGEIEAQLNQHPQIKGSAVVVQGHEANKQLIGFYVATATLADQIITLPIDDLRAHLLRTLPEYMVPIALVSVEAIPLTPNGKINRRALENMDVSLASSEAYLAPRNDIEKQLVAIWAQVLNLEPEKIGVNDNFFELGGHSLLATQLISKMRNEFKIDLPLRALFEYASIARLSECITTTEKSRIPAILPVDRKAWAQFPLSFAQERLWFIDQLEAGSASYNVPGAVTISGELDINQVEYAINLIIARHENLRTIFPSQDGQAQQVILDHLEFSLERIDLRDDETEIRQSKAQQLCEIEAATPFDLATGPLIRGKVITLAPQQHILMLNLHHIVSDGWSIAVLMKEFGAIMDALQQGTAVDLPRLPIQYVDYSVWQRKWLEEGGVLKQQLAYWKEKLAGVPESVNLATDYPRPLLQSYAGASHPFTLGKQLTAHLKNLAEQQSCTLYMTLLAAVKVLLYRYSGQEDICVGGPIANRQYGETEGLIGMFVNTLALRSLLKSEDTFTAVLGKVKTTCLEAYEHQDTPFEKIVELVQVQRNMAMSPLFQIMVSLQNTPIEKFEQHIRAYPLNNGISKFDLTVEFTESSEGLDGIIEYSTALYKPQTIERMVTNFISLCEAIVAESGAKIRDLDYLDPVEKHRLLTDFNNTQADYPQDKCLHQLFAEQVKRTPEKIAVVYENESLSYQQLYDKSYALAVYLQSLGVKPDSLVGLCVERSLDMLVGMLGILQAGGAYVPLDPDYPDDRLAYMLQDSQTAIVLTQENLKGKLSAFAAKDTKLIALDTQWPVIRTCVTELTAAKITLCQEVTPDHLAYVIYTSGSTGKPKGAANIHRGFVNLNIWYIDQLKMVEADHIIVISNPSFDLTQKNLMGPLLKGACLFLIKDYDPIHIRKLINDKKISWVNCAPSSFYGLLEQPYAELTHLKTVVLGGEPIQYTKIAPWFNLYKGKINLYNSYGPTESSDVVSCYACDELQPSFPIGTPISNTQIYILDHYNQLQPIGIPGELHIAGDGLARGYLNRPELTDEKFVPNPFNSGTRLYKTGDLARWLDNGTIEYLGRIDTQIKIRGFRIETGEIEARLNQHPYVDDSVVVAQGQEGNKQLIAFYVVRGTTPDPVIALSHEELRIHLQCALPEYMLPAAFVSLEAIPLTPNGKINRRALESMEVSLASSEAYLAPRNDIEKQLVAIWAEVLNLEPEKIGVNDNFFDLGGHSLLAVQLMSKANRQFKQLLPLAALFTAPNVATLAQLILSEKATSFDILVPIQTKGDKLPIFGIPGAGGNTLSLQPLSRALGNKQPFYSLQAVGLDGETTPFDSVEKTAKANIVALQAIQTIGPYNLIGHSYGGIVAYEMARILIEQGEKIESLILLDSLEPSVWQTHAESDEITLLFEVCTSVASLYGADLNLDIKQLRKVATPNRSEYIVNKLVKYGLDINVKQFTAFYNVFKANERCYRTYKPSILSEKIDVSLFRANERSRAMQVIPNDYGWSQLLGNQISIHDINADHFSMLDNIHAPEIAKLVFQRPARG